jgi:hypothetical protein
MWRIFPGTALDSARRGGVVKWAKATRHSRGVSVYLAYVDDSSDAKLACFSAIVLPASAWLRLLNETLDFRRSLKRSDGIHITKEFHATKFVAGRGNLGALVTKNRRARIFDETLDFIASRTNVRILNTCVPRAHETRAFERLVDRLNVGAGKHIPPTHVMIISDEGKNYNSLVRRMRRYNPVHSRFGAWASGGIVQNRPITRVVEDIVYRDSRHSQFIQLADFCAFALLRSENPVASRSYYGLDKSFDRLRAVLQTKAFAKDPRGLGIIRET